MNKSRTVPIAILTLMLLCCVAASGGYVLYRARGRRAMEERPLVLIHSPVNGEQLVQQESVSIHATARAEGGVSQIELWVDGVFVSMQRTAVETGISPLVMASSWAPQTLGDHVLVVRAVSAGGVTGQASVVVEVTAEEVARAEGEETETEEVDLPEDEAPEEETPGGGPPVEQPPGEEPPSEEPPTDETPRDEPPREEPPEEEAPEGSPDEIPEGVGEPPDPIVAGPEFDLTALELLIAGQGPGMVRSRFSSDPVGLRIELLALQTEGSYEALHCYLGVAEREPVWVPDTDGNQDTNESFARLAFAPEGGSAWEVAEHLSGEMAPTTFWPGDRPLLIDLTCVGIAGGGTDAVELGRIETAVEPVAWDGVSRRLESVGGEAAFTIEYRIDQIETSSRGQAKGIDHTMTRPENLTIDRTGYLRWEYHPRTEPEPEEPIDGFRIYLNESFQWVVPASARETRLPAQWLNPPCGDRYSFTVSAYHNEGCPADCRESPHSDPRAREGGDMGSPECGRQVVVDFNLLLTGDLGEDGRYDPGDVGPVYGWFYVNDQELFFDGRCVEGGRGTRHCAEIGLNHLSQYHINTLTVPLGGRAPRFVVHVPDGEALTVAYNITDADTGRNNADDLVCLGEHAFLDVEAGAYTLTNYWPQVADRCRVQYTVDYADGSPVIESGDSLPLPLLEIEAVEVNTYDNELQIRVRNIGSADWKHDVIVGLTRRESGESLGTRSFRDVNLPIGGELLLSASRAPEDPMDVCVTLDPNHAVTELGEESSADTVHEPHCPLLPDLVIDDVMYDSGRQKLIVVIRNVGDGMLWDGDLDLLVRFSDGDEIRAPTSWWGDTTMWPRGITNLEWPPPATEPSLDQSQLAEGYTVVLDPDDTISESDDDNNSFDVYTGAWLRVMWSHIEAPYSARNTVEFNFDVEILSGSGSRSIADWYVEQDIDWTSDCDRLHDYTACSKSLGYDTGWFYVAGDETLRIDSSASHPGTLSYRGGRHVWRFRAEDGWDGPQDVTDAGYCGDQPINRRDWAFDQVPIGVNTVNWGVGFYYCIDRDR